MGNLSNLFISTSYQSLIHLGNDNTITSSLVELQDGLGNSIGVSVNSAGDLSISGSLTSSLQEGYVLVGGIGNKTKTVATSSFVDVTDLGPLNQFTSSQETKNATLAIYTGSVNQKFSTIGTQSGSWDNSSLNQFTSSQDTKNATLATYTGSVNTKFSTIGTQSGSWDNTLLNSFTASQESKNSTLATYTGSIDTKFATIGTQSGSWDNTQLNLYTASNDTKWNTLGSISGSWITNSQTSSMSVNFANTATSASHAVIADSALTSITAQDIIVNAKNTTGLVIPKGAVVRITGASGDNPEIGLADWTNDGVSANTLGITAESVAVNGFTNVVTQGRIIGLSTNTFTAGQVIFLGPNGTIVASVPTPYHEVRLGQVLRSQANNGSIYVSVDNGYELTELHDVNIVTSSLANNNLLAYDSASQQWTNKTINSLGIPELNANNTFTGTLNQFQNISAVSASFQYVQTITGSAVIIGQSFVIVNNDTPTAPYGGLSVYDSGSVTPTTSSLVWDGNTNDWKYSYDVGAGHDAAVMLFGPGGADLANTPYPANNKLQKGTGGHHLAESSIYDDGTTVAVGANLSVTGSITTNGSSVLTATDLSPLNSFTSSQESKDSTLASYTGSVDTQLTNLTTSQSIDNTKFNTIGTQSGSWENVPLTSLNTFTSSQEILNTQLLNASSSFEAKFATIGTQSGSWSGGGGTDLTSLNAFTASQEVLNATYATTGSNNFNGNQTINGSSTLNVGGTIVGNSSIYALNSNVISAANVNNSGSQYPGFTAIVSATETPTDVYGGFSVNNSEGQTLTSLVVNSYSPQYGGTPTPMIVANGNNPDGSDTAIGFTSNGQMDVWKKSNFKYGVDVTGSLKINGNLTASLQEGYVWVGGAGNTTITAPTSSFGGGGTIVGYATTGSNVFVGNQQITGSLSVSGSINTSVISLTITSNTASLNASTGNTFQLNLVSGSATRLEVSGTQSGQTINLLVSQSATGPGTLVFGDNIVEPSGSFYSASQAASAEDILTMATFVNPSKLYVANIKNLI